MKYQLNYLAVAFLMLFVLQVHAYDFEVDGIFYNVKSTEEKTVEVTKNDNAPYSGDIVIPNCVTFRNVEYTVTEIGNLAFYQNTQITSITIPESMTYINQNIWKYCTSLRTLNYNAVNCEMYRSSYVDNRGFAKASFTEVNIGPKVKYLPYEFINGCPNVKEIIIPKSVEGIAWNAFTSSGLEHVVVEANLSGEGIEKAIDVTEVDLRNCANLTKLELKGNMKKINLSYCSSLSEIEIPNCVTSICLTGTNITTITLPSNITMVENMFKSCEKLTDIHMSAKVPPTYLSTAFDLRQLDIVTIHVPKGCLAAYKVAEGWKEFSIVEEVTIVDSGECGENATWTLDDEGLLTISGTGAMTNTHIGTAPWYDYRSSIKNVQIENGITTVGSYAFGGCYNLTEITIPNSVTSIGSFAFRYCSGLTSITIPNPVTSIGSFAFYGCSGLTSIVVEDGNNVYDSRDNCNAIIETSTNTLIAGCQNTVIPNSVTSIGRSAFYGCSSLTSITIPNSVTSIGSSAFEGCYSLTSITIPNSVTAIGSLAFEGCSGLTSIVVEDGNKVYDSRDNCNAIIETSTNTLIAGCQNTVIPNSVTSIGDDAFRGCSNLTSITIPNSVTSIGSSAFRGCSSLTSITIPNSVTSIGYDAFFQCSNLTEITIPNSMTSIGKGAFYGCEKLTSVTNYSTTPQQIASNTFSNYGTLHVVKGAGEAYANADYWKNFTIVEDATYANIIASGECGENATWTLDDEGLLTISGTGAMTDYNSSESIPWRNYRTSVKNVKIENGITKIAIFAFYGCSALTSITIPTSVTSIEYYAFYGCSGLTNITIPSSVTSIGRYAFRGCSGLTSIVVEDGNKVYDSRDNCNGIIEKSTNTLIVGCQNTIIPNSVTSIGGDAFYGCSSLTSITIPSSVTSIGSGAFSGCYNLVSVTNYSATPQGPISTFSNMENATLVVPSGCKQTYQATAPWSGFANIVEMLNIEGKCGDNLTYRLDEAGVLTIEGSGNMYDYSSSSSVPWADGYVKELKLSEGITSIGARAMFNTLIRSVEFPNSLHSIGQQSFQNCDLLSSVSIPASVSSIGMYAFFACDLLETITVDPNNQNYCSVDDVLFNKSKNVLIVCAPKKQGDYQIPNSVTTIQSRAFYKCKELTSVLMPNSISNIGAYTFAYNYSLKNVGMSNSVTSIGNFAFYNCTKLESFEMPSSLITIGSSAFEECYNWGTINIPAYVTEIGDAAFAWCNTNTITVDENNPYYCSEDNVMFNKDKSVLIKCAAAKTGNYTIPNTVKTIEGWAFDICYISSVDIPNSVTTIKKSAFRYCGNLVSVTIPSSVESIVENAFYGCYKLSDITNLAKTPQSITENVFEGTPSSKTLHVVKGAGEAYANADYWKNFTIVEDAVDPLNSDTDISEYDNILYIDKTEVRLGQQAVLSFKMKNTAAIQTIGVYLELPEGMTVVEDDGDLLIDLSIVRTKALRHAISSNYVDGLYRIGILGTAGRAFEGTDGEVFTVTVDIDEKMAEGDYPIVLRNINLTDTNDVPYNTDYYKTTISVIDITPGDANGDGSVNMTDANIVTNYFLGKTNAVMKAKAADVNNDGSINMTDANMIVNMYLNQ